MMISIVVCGGCSDEQRNTEVRPPKRPTIAVTSWPLLSMARCLAGDDGDVQLVVPPDTISPDWKPSAESVRTLQEAVRILISGSGYEPWIRRVTLPETRVVDTGAGYRDQVIRVSDAVIHQHGPDGRHSHEGDVWATWLDPELAIAQAQLVQKTIEELRPADVDNVRMLSGPLEAELQAVDARTAAIARSTENDQILVLGDGPFYHYLVRRLGWTLEYVHLPAAGPLTEEQKTELSEAIVRHNPQLVFVRTSLWKDLAGIRDELSATFVEIDLCVRPGTEESLAARLQRNLASIQEALKKNSSKE